MADLNLEQYKKATKGNGGNRTYLAFRKGSYGFDIVKKARGLGYNVEAIVEDLFKQAGLEKQLK